GSEQPELRSLTPKRQISGGTLCKDPRSLRSHYFCSRRRHYSVKNIIQNGGLGRSWLLQRTTRTAARFTNMMFRSKWAELCMSYFMRRPTGQTRLLTALDSTCWYRSEQRQWLSTTFLDARSRCRSSVVSQ